jgi:YVTN family beta-propeller protein
MKFFNFVFCVLFANIVANNGLAFILESPGYVLSILDPGTKEFTSRSNADKIPVAIAIAKDSQLAYVVNQSSPLGSVSVISLTDYKIVNEIVVGKTPTSIAISPEGSFAYVSNLESNDISVIDLSTQSIIHRISNQKLPFDGPRCVRFSKDGSFAYVANSNNSAGIFVIDTKNHEVIHRIGFMGIKPWNIAMASHFAYVTNNAGSSVSVIDTDTHTFREMVTVGNEPRAIAISPDEAFVYVANFADDTISVVNTEERIVVKKIKIPSKRLMDIAVSQEGDRIYVLDFMGNIFVINTSEWK